MKLSFKSINGKLRILVNKILNTPDRFPLYKYVIAQKCCCKEEQEPEVPVLPFAKCCVDTPQYPQDYIFIPISNYEQVTGLTLDDYWNWNTTPKKDRCWIKFRNSCYYPYRYMVPGVATTISEVIRDGGTVVTGGFRCAMLTPEEAELPELSLSGCEMRDCGGRCCANCCWILTPYLDVQDPAYGRNVEGQPNAAELIRQGKAKCCNWGDEWVMRISSKATRRSKTWGLVPCRDFVLNLQEDDYESTDFAEYTINNTECDQFGLPLRYRRHTGRRQGYWSIREWFYTFPAGLPCGTYTVTERVTTGQPDEQNYSWDYLGWSDEGSSPLLQALPFFRWWPEARERTSSGYSLQGSSYEIGGPDSGGYPPTPTNPQAGWFETSFEWNFSPIECDRGTGKIKRMRREFSCLEVRGTECVRQLNRRLVVEEESFTWTMQPTYGIDCLPDWCNDYVTTGDRCSNRRGIRPPSPFMGTMPTGSGITLTRTGRAPVEGALSFL